MTTKRVVLTGAGGGIGSQVIPLLLNDPEIFHVWGVDVAPMQMPPHPKFTSVQIDIRDPDIHRVFQDADCLIHLAFVVKNIHDDAKAREINEAGTENLLQACRIHSVKKIIFTSSAAVYGSWPENPLNMSEDTPLRPDPDHVYSVSKAAVERRLQEFRKTDEGSIVCILRPVLVVGPETNNTLVNLFRGKIFFFVRGFDPTIQVLHLDDMARAIHLASRKDFGGVFNVGPIDALSLSKVCRALRMRCIQVPAPLFLFLVRLLYGLRLSSIPPQSISRFLYPLTVDSSRFQNLFQWTPRYSTLESIAQLKD